MKYQEACSCCGNKVTCYSHHLNTALVKALRQLVDRYETSLTPTNLQRDLDLTKNQYNNFQKLQYFGLVSRTPKGWFPTPVGIGFIRGDIRVWDKVATLSNVALDSTHQAWKTATQLPVLVSVYDIDRESWKKKEEYREEKSSQERFDW